MREGRKRFPAGPRKARPGKGDQFRIGELIWVAGAGIGEEWRRRCDRHHTATPQLGGSPVRRGIAVQAVPAPPSPRSSRAFDCLAGAQDRAACHKSATPPISVRVERDDGSDSRLDALGPIDIQLWPPANGGFSRFRCSCAISTLRSGSRKTTIFASPSSECRSVPRPVGIRRSARCLIGSSC